MTILILHGPNLNLLGKRAKEHYGQLTLDQVNLKCEEVGKRHGVDVQCFQTNHEGAMIDYIQQHASSAQGIVINPGAWTHYSYAVHDALLDSGLPVVEAHLSNIEDREEWRRHSVIAPVCVHRVMGKKEKSYTEGLEFLISYLTNHENK